MGRLQWSAVLFGWAACGTEPPADDLRGWWVDDDASTEAVVAEVALDVGDGGEVRAVVTQVFTLSPDARLSGVAERYGTWTAEGATSTFVFPGYDAIYGVATDVTLTCTRTGDALDCVAPGEPPLHYERSAPPPPFDGWTLATLTAYGETTTLPVLSSDTVDGLTIDHTLDYRLVLGADGEAVRTEVDRMETIHEVYTNGGSVVGTWTDGDPLAIDLPPLAGPGGALQCSATEATLTCTSTDPTSDAEEVWTR